MHGEYWVDCVPTLFLIEATERLSDSVCRANMVIIGSSSEPNNSGNKKIRIYKIVQEIYEFIFNLNKR